MGNLWLGTGLKFPDCEIMGPERQPEVLPRRHRGVKPCQESKSTLRKIGLGRNRRDPCKDEDGNELVRRGIPLRKGTERMEPLQTRGEAVGQIMKL